MVLIISPPDISTMSRSCQVNRFINLERFGKHVQCYLIFKVHKDNRMSSEYVALPSSEDVANKEVFLNK